MEDGGGGEIGKLSKKLAERGVVPGEEVDYKTKAGTAWSHSFLNQKPWHPLSYPNQRRKWIAEQTHANRARRTEEVAREFAQEQEFFRQTALFSKKEQEKLETMKAVSFMYVRPPGYNPESAKAAEIADEKKKLDPNNVTQDPTNEISREMPETKPDKSQTGGDKKARPKDVFGRALPTEQEFEVLKNAPRLETGLPVRNKPFGVEIRNVRCLRCGVYGHQSGDRECPMKDAIMPNEESRLIRDDPLTAIKVQEDSGEPLKWELKQKPGMSPPRGGYQPDDPNQQIVAEDIFDEYGGFLGGGDIPALLSNFTANKSKRHSKHKSKRKRHHDSNAASSSDSELERDKKRKSKSKNEDDRELDRDKKRKLKSKNKKKKHRHSDSSTSDSSDSDHHCRDKHRQHSYHSHGHRHRSRGKHQAHSSSSEFDSPDFHSHRRRKKRRHHSDSSS